MSFFLKAHIWPAKFRSRGTTYCSYLLLTSMSTACFSFLYGVYSIFSQPPCTLRSSHTNKDSSKIQNLNGIFVSVRSIKTVSHNKRSSKDWKWSHKTPGSLTVWVGWRFLEDSMKILDQTIFDRIFISVTRPLLSCFEMIWSLLVSCLCVLCSCPQRSWLFPPYHHGLTRSYES